LERVIKAVETVLLAGSSFEEPSADVDKRKLDVLPSQGQSDD